MPQFIFLFSLAFLIIFSCLSYASVTIFPISVIESVIAAMFFFWLSKMAYGKKIELARTGLLVPVILFFGVIVFQLIPLPLNFIKSISINAALLYEKFCAYRADSYPFFLSIYPNNTLAELLKLSAYLGLFLLVINNIYSKRQAGIIINLIIFFGLFISVFGLIKKYADLSSRSFGPFLNRNNFAGYINLIIPLALGFSLTEMPLSKRIIYGVSVSVMILALFMSASRAGVLVFGFNLLLFMFLSQLKDGLRGRISMLYLWFFIAILFFILFLNSKTVWVKLSSLFERNTYLFIGHGYSWLDILKICKDFPIFGTGLGTFGSISYMYKSTPFQSSFSYAHNDFLQLFSEVGLVGFVFVSLFFLLYFKSVIKIWLKRHDLYVIGLVLGGVTSIIGMLVYSALDFNLQIPAVALLFFIIMGLTFRLTTLENDHGVSK